MGLRDRTLLTEGRCFFVTTTCEAHGFFLIDKACFDILYENIHFYNEKYKARLIAYVFMSNHIHLILYFDEDMRLSDYMRDFKKMTSRKLRDYLLKRHTGLATSLVHETRNQFFKIWEDRFDDVWLNSRDVCETKLAYMHENPVKAGLVNVPEDYPHSSARFYLTTNKHSALLDYRDVF